MEKAGRDGERRLIPTLQGGFMSLMSGGMTGRMSLHGRAVRRLFTALDAAYTLWQMALATKSSAICHFSSCPASGGLRASPAESLLKTLPGSHEHGRSADLRKLPD